jgi:hypothetical protein
MYTITNTVFSYETWATNDPKRERWITIHNAKDPESIRPSALISLRLDILGPVIIFGEMGHRGINTEKCVIRTFLGCLILFTRISWLSDNMIIPPVTVGYAQEAFGSFKNRRHKMAG